MSVLEELLVRSGGKCELCSTKSQLETYLLPPQLEVNIDHCVGVCDTCLSQIENPDSLDSKHFHALSTNMWSDTPAIQVMSYRVLKMFGANSWAVDQLDQLYLEDDLKAWAESGLQLDKVKTLDSNGSVLSQGDSVTLIKDLVVKGAGFKAKRGTTVKNISLTDDPKHIEGRVNGTRIVLVAAYLKKV